MFRVLRTFLTMSYFPRVFLILINLNNGYSVLNIKAGLRVEKTNRFQQIFWRTAFFIGKTRHEFQHLRPLFLSSTIPWI